MVIKEVNRVVSVVTVRVVVVFLIVRDGGSFCSWKHEHTHTIDSCCSGNTRAAGGFSEGAALCVCPLLTAYTFGR